MWAAKHCSIQFATILQTVVRFLLGNQRTPHFKTFLFVLLFFIYTGMHKLRFKPAFNPYTEPSMEIFGYHEGTVVNK